MRATLFLLCLPWASLLAQTCVQTLSPNARSLPASTNPLFQGTFNVASNLSTCNWTSTSNAPWIAVQVGQTGRGNGIVGYSVDNNQTPLERTGTIQVGNAVFTVTQAAAVCNATLTLQGGASLSADGGTRQLLVATTCEWTVTAPEWIVASPPRATGNGIISLTISPNNTTAVRTGAVTVLGQSVSITQAAGTCALILTPAQQTVAAAGGAFSMQLATSLRLDCCVHSGLDHTKFTHQRHRRIRHQLHGCCEHIS